MMLMVDWKVYKYFKRIKNMSKPKSLLLTSVSFLRHEKSGAPTISFLFEAKNIDNVLHGGGVHPGEGHKLRPSPGCTTVR
jgi:hypothetical protein